MSLYVVKGDSFSSYHLKRLVTAHLNIPAPPSFSAPVALATDLHHLQRLPPWDPPPLPTATLIWLRWDAHCRAPASSPSTSHPPPPTAGQGPSLYDGDQRRAREEVEEKERDGADLWQDPYVMRRRQRRLIVSNSFALKLLSPLRFVY